MLFSNKYQIKLKDTEHRHTITASATTAAMLLNAEVKRKKKLNEIRSRAYVIFNLHNEITPRRVLRATERSFRIRICTRNHLHNDYGGNESVARWRMGACMSAATIFPSADEYVRPT